MWYGILHFGNKSLKYMATGSDLNGNEFSFKNAWKIIRKKGMENNLAQRDLVFKSWLISMTQIDNIDHLF